MAKTYHTPKIGRFIYALSLEFGFDYSKACGFLREKFPEIKDEKHCPSCDSLMLQYEYYLDSIISRLLVAMGDCVRRKLDLGLHFTEANKIKVQTEIAANYAVTSATTKASLLGLIAKVRHKGTKTHNKNAGWLITRRGWELLAGGAVPSKVLTFNGKIVERSDEKITLAQALARKPRRKNFTHGVYIHNPSDWAALAYKAKIYIPDHLELEDNQSDEDLN